MLAGIRAEVLRRERMGVGKLLRPGEHSLLAARVVSRVSELIGVELPLRVLFEEATVAELAGRVDVARDMMDVQFPS